MIDKRIIDLSSTRFLVFDEADEFLEKEIYELAGQTFVINSPKQLAVVLFEKLKLPPGRKNKTGYR